jgi:hypothetical protein
MSIRIAGAVRQSQKGIIMYITRRMARVNGRPGIEWASQVTKVVQAAGGRTSLWAGGPGSTVGTIAWSSLVDSFAAVVENADRLNQNEEFLALVSQASQHVISMEPDTMMQVVHGEITGQAEVGSFLAAVTATTDPARGMEALAWAPVIADAWTAATGLAVAVATNVAGPMDTIQWLVRFDDAAAVDEANAKIAASNEYLEVYATGAGLFTSDSNQMYARRIA